jgi:hypothetical protein
MGVPMKCGLCDKEMSRMAKHYANAHPTELGEQRARVVSLYLGGATAQEIAALPDIIYKAKSSVVSVLNREIDKEIIDKHRVDSISKTVRKKYSNGSLDWLRKLNSDRLKAEPMQKMLVSSRSRTPTKAMATEFGLCYDIKIDLASHLGSVFRVISLKNSNEKCKKELLGLMGEKCVLFEDEYIKKSSIVKSMINYRLDSLSRRIYARTCSVKEITTKAAREFFDKNHLAGGTRSACAFGLYDTNGDLVSCISFRKPFIKKYKNTIEIARFASLAGASVPGGLSKLIKFSKDLFYAEGYDAILTYADRRLGSGASYEKVGDYFYTDGHTRFHRFKFRAQNGKPEKEVAAEAGVHRVYGCGSNIFMMNLGEKR